MDLVEEIKKINRDNNLSNEEKIKLIQELRNKNMVQILSTKCDHYNKKCSNFYFECCDKYSSCHRCHEEEHKCEVLPPRKVTSIECNECNTRQIPSNKCINCEIEFAKSFCLVCCIWTEKDIIHCDKCGICRVGKEIFHCDDCNMCFNQKDHDCKHENFDKVCPFCLESTFYSQYESTKVSNCTHTFHRNCLEEAFKNNILNCPLCRKLLLNDDLKKNYWNNNKQLITSTIMPCLSNNDINIDEIVGSKFGLIKIKKKHEENIEGYLIDWILKKENKVKVYINYKDVLKTVNIQCNECNLRSDNVYFHYYGLECKYCKGYNTSMN